MEVSNPWGTPLIIQYHPFFVWIFNEINQTPAVKTGARAQTLSFVAKGPGLSTPLFTLFYLWELDSYGCCVTIQLCQDSARMPSLSPWTFCISEISCSCPQNARDVGVGCFFATDWVYLVYHWSIDIALGISRICTYIYNGCWVCLKNGEYHWIPSKLPF